MGQVSSVGSHNVTPRGGARGKREELHLSVIPCVLDPKCVRTCSSKLQGPVVKTQDFCELGYVGLAAGNQPWWEYCHHRDEQTLQIKLRCWLLNIHQHATGLLGAAQSQGLLIPPQSGLSCLGVTPGPTATEGVRTCGRGPGAFAPNVHACV